MVSDVISPLDKFKRLLNPTVNIIPGTKRTLWRINRDGTGKRLIGVDDSSNASGLLWSPDGKHITLFNKDALFSIPVE